MLGGFQVTWLPYLVAGGLMLALAAWLMWLDAGSRPNRAFALFLVFRSTSMLVLGARSGTTDLEAAALLTSVAPYFLIPVVPAVIYFASVYPRPRGPFRGRAGAWSLLGVTVAAELAYLLDHGTVWTFAAGSTATYLSAGSGLVYTSFGPLILFVVTQQIATAALALLFVRDYVRAPTGSRRFSAFLVCAGFAVNATFDGALQVAAASTLLADPAAYDWSGWSGVRAVVPALTIVPAAALVAYLLVRGLGSPDRDTRTHLLGLAAVAILPVLSVLALGSRGGGSVFLAGPTAELVLGAWRLTLPLLVSWSLLRYQLFDIDVRVRGTIKAGTVLGAFLLAFALVSEIASNLVQERVGTTVGIAAAVGMAFALRPLERRAELLARRVVPDARAVDDLHGDERSRFYREQAALAWQDGEIREKERAMLERLRTHLGLAPDEAARIEADVARETGSAA